MTRGRWVSPLMLRILAVNLVAPLLLVAGILYLNQYERALLDSEMEALRGHADLIAAALGEGAVTADTALFTDARIPVTCHMLDRVEASAMVIRLGSLSGDRVRLFDSDGILIADSTGLSRKKHAVEMTDLPPLDNERTSFLQGWVNALANSLRGLPDYRESADQTASDYSEVLNALEQGRTGLSLRVLSSGRRLMSAAAPITFYRHVVGSVMVSRPDTAVARGLYRTRRDILNMFFSTLTVTVLVSAYLGRGIARPVQQLAKAADRVRSQRGRHHRIPDLSARHDEIGDLSVSLHHMTESLYKRMDETERFAADVAHEIKNPLTSIRSAIETIDRLDDSCKKARLLNIVKDDVDRLDRLISDISDASRVDAELSRTEGTFIALRPLLQILGEVCTPALNEHKIGIRLELPEHDTQAIVHGSEDRIVQVLRNLIGNAQSFSPEGSTLTLGLHLSANRAHITVEDEGPGIPTGKEEAIFERFYSERPRKEAFGSHSGLGLSISRQIVVSHGGTIHAENRMDDVGNIMGARFTVSLPLATPLSLPDGEKPKSAVREHNLHASTDFSDATG
ncbi:HAMP domain-containing protein [Haematospirillum sp. 15-248]|uniref:stimulus-sensing domain-containing protein n=1 Tax=Haematospirillum sp. 15-248 TaxID=2723107 RepID=UPI001438E02E|nr:stimulus-sensing domain-containing protein [Haematospirillum sp. 15-248]NKD88211.1 HAMP domain-containing protein [Haematospirillum sp. 15-248]